MIRSQTYSGFFFKHSVISKVLYDMLKDFSDPMVPARYCNQLNSVTNANPKSAILKKYIFHSFDMCLATAIHNFKWVKNNHIMFK